MTMTLMFFSSSLLPHPGTRRQRVIGTLAPRGAPRVNQTQIRWSVLKLCDGRDCRECRHEQNADQRDVPASRPRVPPNMAGAPGSQRLSMNTATEYRGLTRFPIRSRQVCETSSCAS